MHVITKYNLPLFRFLSNNCCFQIDVEGAECKVFSKGADLQWLDSTSMVLAELHDKYSSFFGLREVSSIVEGAMKSKHFKRATHSEHEIWTRT